MTIKYAWRKIKSSSKTKDGLLDLLIYRKVAYVSTYFFANYVEATPNHITSLALISWLSSTFFIWHNNSIMAAFLIFLGFVLDCTDGNIARLKSQASFTGKLYDSVVDRVSYSIILSVLWMKRSMASVTNYSIILVGYFILVIISFVMRIYVERRKKADIHEVGVINNFESKVKSKLSKLVPFVDWNKIILGPGPGTSWTILIVASIIPTIFTFLVVIVMVLTVGGVCLTMYAYRLRRR